MPFATVLDKSVPVVPKVIAATLVTVPTKASAYCGIFNVFAIRVDAPLVPVVVKVIVPCLLLNVVQSAEDKYPFTEVVATGIEIVFTVLTKGEENVNTDSLALKVVQFAELKAPRLVADAVGILKVCVSTELEILKSVPVVPVAKY